MLNIKNKAFNKLMREIEFVPTKSFEDAEITNVKKVNNILEIGIKVSKIIPFEEMIEFLKKLNKNMKYKASPEFKVEVCVFNAIEIKKYLSWILKSILKQTHLAAIINDESELKIIENRECVAIISSSGSYLDLNMKKDDLGRIMRKFGFKNFIFSTKLIEFETNPLEIEKKKHTNTADVFFRNIKEEVDDSKKVISTPANYRKIKIEDLETIDARNVVVEGKIFNIPEEFETKSGYTIVTYLLSNYK